MKKRNPFYSEWRNMMYRCYNPNSPDYASYGGRGIKVCKEWHTRTNFYGWAELNRKTADLELDRWDNDEDYCPANCRYVSRKVNANNRRCTIRLPDGDSLALFCSELGIATFEKSRKSPTNQYHAIASTWRERKKIHPELMSALRKDTRKQARLLYQAAMLRQEFETRVNELKEKVAKLIERGIIKSDSSVMGSLLPSVAK